MVYVELVKSPSTEGMVMVFVEICNFMGGFLLCCWIFVILWGHHGLDRVVPIATKMSSNSGIFHTSCGTVWSFASFLIFVDHRATNFTLSKICETATLILLHLQQ